MKGRCMSPGCLKPAIQNRGFCQLHVEKGRIRKASQPKGLSPYERYIYAIECADYIKIGQTKTPRKRFQAIRGANPLDLKLLGYVALPFDYEQKIHDYLADYRHKLEWFTRHPKVMSVVDMIVGKRAEEIISILS